MSFPDDQPSSPDSPGPAHERDARFATTQWSMVLRAGRGNSTHAQQALARLCKIYWYPLYAYVRRRGHAAHDAQDLTQAFFARLLEQQSLGKADPTRGRFRSFMLASLSHFLADEWEKGRAQKRGGTHEIVSLDFAAAERRLDLEPVDQRGGPDRAFDRQWAMALLDTVLQRLQEEYVRAGKTALFEALRSTLTGTSETQPYVALAVQLGLSEGAVKVGVHRLRHRYRDLVQAEIDETVDSAEEAEQERLELFRALSGGL
jgi:RNA polymerase sigma factor (sigma-70 family)